MEFLTYSRCFWAVHGNLREKRNFSNLPSGKTPRVNSMNFLLMKCHKLTFKFWETAPVGKTRKPILPFSILVQYLLEQAVCQVTCMIHRKKLALEGSVCFPCFKYLPGSLLFKIKSCVLCSLIFFNFY